MNIMFIDPDAEKEFWMIAFLHDSDIFELQKKFHYAMQCHHNIIILAGLVVESAFL